jgi:hypothetical protein
MTFKVFKVFFARTSVGAEGLPLSGFLADSVRQHGQNLPMLDVSGERFQMRDMHLVGTVWKGTFVKLRDDAPHVVAANDQEHELDLEEGEHLIEKCHFLLRTRGNVLVWQANRSAGGMSRAENYLSSLFDTAVLLPHVMNDAELEGVLNGQLYELDFAYDRPPAVPGRAPRWNQDAFDMMAGIDAAHAKFTLRAPRNGGLADQAKQMVRQILGTPGTGKVRIKLADDKEPIELFMAPLKDSLKVEMIGRYPLAVHVFEGLEEAFNRQRGSIPRLDDVR